MKPLLIALALATFATPVLSQSEGQSRGSIPLGQSQDGSKPSDGAITGGSILPGEKSGMPDKPIAASEEREKRCMQLSGVLREECLLNERSATGGGTVAPDTQSGTPPRTTPPPQNPR
ncbi:MAG TPA: hypothetical protein VD965_01755 [Burkholderiales bacterium]|nr:hypothetical protein [Burkholderiales bacterium]